MGAKTDRASKTPTPSKPGTTKGGSYPKLAVWGTILLALTVTWQFLESVKHRWYIFDPPTLHQVSLAAIEKHGGDTKAMIDFIIRNLTETHGAKHINQRQDEWVFNNAGGAMGAMYVIHASITEYLLIFGTAIGTEGHTGRHTADDYYHVLQGEQWAYSPPSLEMEVYGVGSQHHLPRGKAKHYKMHKGCFGLEYARGWIPPMLPFGFADMLLSTIDFPTMFDTTWISAREIVRNLLVGKI